MPSAWIWTRYNFFKVMQEQTKAIMLTWSTTSGGRAGCVRFQVAKKRSADGEDLNELMTNVVKEVLKENKHTKDTATHNYGLE